MSFRLQEEESFIRNHLFCMVFSYSVIVIYYFTFFPNTFKQLVNVIMNPPLQA